MKRTVFNSIFFCLALPGIGLAAAPNGHDRNGERLAIEANTDAEALFERMRTVMSGVWAGQFTNGTFDEPDKWLPVTVEYRQTSNGTAIVEHYFTRNPEPDGLTPASMTTVYFRDRGNLRLTHFCGAANHPSMRATSLDAENSAAEFEFTHITNLEAPEDYHSRTFQLEIVADDHIRIQYHGVMDGEVHSQAYDLRLNADHPFSD